MIQNISLIEALPKVIETEAANYSLVMYVTAWEKLCIAYANQMNPHEDKIFCIVVEPGNHNEHDDLDHIDDLTEIYTVSSLMKAVNLMYDSLLYNGIIELNDIDPYDYTAVDGFEELDLDPVEEEMIEPNVDITEEDYIKIVNKDFAQCEAVAGDIVEASDARNASKYLEMKLYLDDLELKSYSKMFPVENDENGDYVKITIDVRDGKVVDWKGKKSINVFLKVCDSGEYRMYDKDWKLVCVLEGYVPKICAFRETNYGWGDYVSMEINKDGFIEYWPKDSDLEFLLNDFIYDAFTLCEQ